MLRIQWLTGMLQILFILAKRVRQYQNRFPDCESYGFFEEGFLIYVYELVWWYEVFDSIMFDRDSCYNTIQESFSRGIEGTHKYSNVSYYFQINDNQNERFSYSRMCNRVVYWFLAVIEISILRHNAGRFFIRYWEHSYSWLWLIISDQWTIGVSDSNILGCAT